MIKLLPIIIFLLSFSVFSQSDLPEKGSLSDIHNKTKFYLVADNESRKAILKQIEKQKVFTVVDKSDDAEFFIEYKTISRQPIAIAGTTETGQMEVYIYRDKKKIIAWLESTTGGGFKGDTANRLIKKFLKAVETK